MTRLKRITYIMAVMLCVAAFVFPMTAYAASDTAAPTVRAWIDGETLRIEAADTQSNVEAVYINDSRINYRVDNALALSLRDYAGKDEYISIYAINFAGNKSNVVLLKNPYYTLPATTPAATQTPASTSTPEPSQSGVSDPQPFTPDGTGTVVDNVTEQNGKEFFTIITPDENVFYLIIDRERDSDNVYLLNAVTEDDLMALAKKSDGNSVSAIPTPEPTPQQTEPTPEPTPEPEPAANSGGSTGTIILVLLAVAAVGGAGYYIKIYRPKQQQAAEPDEMDEDELDFEDEPEETDEDDYSEDEDTGDDYEDEE